MSVNNFCKPTLLLVDGHSLAFRSFYAFSKSNDGGLTTKEGFPTSVTYGFLKSLLDNCKNISPEGVCIAFDTEKPTFRHELDPNYKANRDVAPDRFFIDIDNLELILKNNLNLPIFKSPGFEADDILGTIANDAASKGWKVNILSGDRDLFQLVDDKKDIYVLYMGGGPYAKSGNPTFMDEDGVHKKLGVAPSKVVDLKALTGDSSDNIPGIKGVGPKTAINLLKENNDLDGIYEKLEKITNSSEKNNSSSIKGALIEKLKKDKFNAYLSKDLAKINISVPLVLENKYELKEVDKDSLSDSLKKLELSTLLRQVDYFYSTFSKGGFNQNKGNIEKIKSKEYLEINKEVENSLPKIKVKIIQNEEDLYELTKKLEATNDFISLDTETTSLNPIDAELVGIGMCTGDKLNEVYYIPIGHKSLKNYKQLDIEDVLNSLRDWLQNSKKLKTLQNCKFDRQIFFNHGIELNGVFFDTLLADYILNNQEKHGLSEIVYRELGFKPASFKEILGKNKDFSYVEIESASVYCGYDVYLTRQISKIFLEKFKKSKDDLFKLYSEIELPLEPVLSQMEVTGIKVDVPYLEELSTELRLALHKIEEKVFNLSGEEFNLSSPKQLGEILFEKLNLDKKKSRKTKTGWSTDALVLDRLVDEHEIISPLIEHRTFSKLLSTYIDALPLLVNNKTGRVHTNFNQAATATGRLSSSNPNLQNIPIRTEFSKRIRKAFLPEKNYKLLSADYSQIELRILAHLAKEEILIKAFNNNEDIHALTAKLIFDKKNITTDERRVGKTINFGVIYGMGVKKFARSTGVNVIEAKDFLIKYKNKYSKIFEFLELQERFALSRGYVETLFGRKREFKFDKNGLGRFIGKDPYDIDLKSARRAGLEAQSLRAAANAPIQGSSADIIKIAMIKIQEQIKRNNFPIKLLIQVHDELLFEVPDDNVALARDFIKKTMEDSVKLDVPLIVDIGVGDNWMETK